MGNRYKRSEIYSFWDMTDEQQKEAINDLGQELAEETQYVDNPTYKNEPLPLCMFERSDPKEHTNLWDGIYPTSAFSAYFIKIARSGDGAVIADRWF